jgi:uncharacterized protein YdhG (YjbR/CyaY superfamily)
MKRPVAKRRTKKRARPIDIDDYLAGMPQPVRATLEKLRKTIQLAAPKATEAINYQVPTFRYHGMLVGFGASAKHCSLYVMSSTVLKTLKEKLRAYEVSTGAIRFTAESPLPVTIVKMIVKARMAENKARALKKAV